ncbi:MAG: hypothetical protein AAF560_29465, partial [Acidobacteriota bacterium]
MAAPTTDPELVTVLDELLSRQSVTLQHRSTAQIDLGAVLAGDTSEHLARIWIDTTGATETRLYIVDRTAERVLVRSVGTSAGNLDEVTRETVGHIIEAAVEALLSGATIGVPR